MVVAFTGDFYQPPPVFDEVLYKPLRTEIGDSDEVSLPGRIRSRVRPRPLKSESHHDFDIWTAVINYSIFLRKNRRAESWSNLRNILTKLKSWNVDSETVI